MEAIEKLSPKDICQELGDLLFQILFLAQLAAERKEFDFIEVVEKITQKMKHRHPHVFGEAKVDNAEDVALNWARIKKEEGGTSREASSALESVPVVLPALLRAHRLSERAAKIGFDWPNAGECWGKIREGFEAVGEAVVKGDKDQFARETGDFLFALVNLARHWGFNAEHMLRLSNEKFSERFRKMEKELKASGVELEKATPEQMNQAWERVK
jgi:MazG family protein